MTALALAPVQPDESDISAAAEALPHVKDYLATHTDSVIRLVVADDPEETLIVPRGAVELLARVLAHMAAGQGVSVVPAHAELTTSRRPSSSTSVDPSSSACSTPATSSTARSASTAESRPSR